MFASNYLPSCRLQVSSHLLLRPVDVSATITRYIEISGVVGCEDVALNFGTPSCDVDIASTVLTFTGDTPTQPCIGGFRADDVDDFAPVDLSLLRRNYFLDTLSGVSRVPHRTTMPSPAHPHQSYLPFPMDLNPVAG